MRRCRNRSNDLMKSPQHVSGDKFAHPQEHFLTIYSFWYNAPTLLQTGAPSQPWHRSAAVLVHCTKSCIYSQKVLLRMGELARKCRVDLKNINKIKSCCILLVVYIVVLRRCTVTQTSSSSTWEVFSVRWFYCTSTLALTEVCVLCPIWQFSSAVHIAPYQLFRLLSKPFFVLPLYVPLHSGLGGFGCEWSALSCLVAVTSPSPRSNLFPITPDVYIPGLQE